MRRRYRQQSSENTDTATNPLAKSSPNNPQDNRIQDNKTTETHTSYRRRYGGNRDNTEVVEKVEKHEVIDNPGNNGKTEVVTTTESRSYRQRRYRSSPKEEEKPNEQVEDKNKYNYHNNNNNNANNNNIITNTTTTTTITTTTTTNNNNNNNSGKRNYYQSSDTTSKSYRNYYKKDNEEKEEKVNPEPDYSRAYKNNREEVKTRNKSYRNEDNTKKNNASSNSRTVNIPRERSENKNNEITSKTYEFPDFFDGPNPPEKIPEYKGKNFAMDFVKEVNKLRRKEDDILKASNKYTSISKIRYTYKPNLKSLVDPLYSRITNSSSLGDLNIDSTLSELAKKYYNKGMKNPMRRVYPTPQKQLEEDLDGLGYNNIKVCKCFVSNVENPRYALFDCIFGHFNIGKSDIFVDNKANHIGVYQGYIKDDSVCVVIIEG